MQVKNLIMKINVNKSSGLDDISNKLLKLAADIVSQSLTHIFDKSLCTGIYPNDWKLPRVVPIHKSGAKQDVNNLNYLSCCKSFWKNYP